MPLITDLPNELIAEIIFNVPDIFINKCMRVCKTWQDIILQTPDIHDKRIRAPMTDRRHIEHDTYKGVLIPLYGTNYQLRAMDPNNGLRIIVPLIACNRHQYKRPTQVFVAYLGQQSQWTREECMDKCLTWPPVQEVAVSMRAVQKDFARFPKAGELFSARLRRKEGLRLRDFVNACNELRQDWLSEEHPDAGDLKTMVFPAAYYLECFELDARPEPPRSTSPSVSDLEGLSLQS